MVRVEGGRGERRRRRRRANPLKQQNGLLWPPDAVKGGEGFERGSERERERKR